MLDLGLLLAQLVVILLAARVAGALVRPLGQPPVIGEMIAGLALGPSVLERWPQAPSPRSSRPTAWCRWPP
jgi:Kef-type K+ transport system membrane component KefB